MRQMIGAICGVGMLVFPLAVAAQGAAGFEGTYQGVSAQAAKYVGQGRCSPPNPVPAPLTVRGGSARWNDMEGTVSPQGTLALRRRDGWTMSGQIDPQGNVRAQASGTNCTYSYVWRRQSR
jgi:hypothetical protein